MSFFQHEQIAKRGEFNGFTGLKFSKRKQENQFLEPPEYLKGDPTFKAAKVLQTMSREDIQHFDRDQLERGRFLESKPNLAGKKAVDEYEDRAEGDEAIVFNPLKSVEEKAQGVNSYDSGGHQGGTKDIDGYLSGSVKVRDNSRGTTLTNQDPYAHQVSTKIKINS